MPPVRMPLSAAREEASRCRCSTRWCRAPSMVCLRTASARSRTTSALASLCTPCQGHTPCCAPPPLAARKQHPAEALHGLWCSLLSSRRSLRQTRMVHLPACRICQLAMPMRAASSVFMAMHCATCLRSATPSSLVSSSWCAAGKQAYRTECFSACTMRPQT